MSKCLTISKWNKNWLTTLKRNQRLLKRFPTRWKFKNHRAKLQLRKNRKSNRRSKRKAMKSTICLHTRLLKCFDYWLSLGSMTFTMILVNSRCKRRNSLSLLASSLKSFRMLWQYLNSIKRSLKLVRHYSRNELMINSLRSDNSKNKARRQSWVFLTLQWALSVSLSVKKRKKRKQRNRKKITRDYLFFSFVFIQKIIVKIKKSICF